MNDGGTESGQTLTINVPPMMFSSELEAKTKMNIIKSDITEHLKSYIGKPYDFELSQSAQEIVNTLSEGLAEEFKFTLDFSEKEESKEYNEEDAKRIGLIL